MIPQLYLSIKHAQIPCLNLEPLARARDRNLNHLAGYNVHQVIPKHHRVVLALQRHALDGHLGADLDHALVNHRLKLLRLLQVEVLERLGPVHVPRDLLPVLYEVRRNNRPGLVALLPRGNLERRDLGRPVLRQDDAPRDDLRVRLLARLDVPRLDQAIHRQIRQLQVRPPDLNLVRHLDVDARVLVPCVAVLAARDADGQRRHLALDGEVGVLRAEVVVADGPRGDGPAVVDLPDEGAAAVLAAGALPLALPQAVRGGEALGLHQLRAVDEVLERVRGVAEVLDQIQGDAPLVAVGLVVEVDGGGLRVAVGVVAAKGEEGVDGLDGGEGLHAELGHEAADEFVEVLVLLLGAVPDVPLVQVANRRVARVVAGPGGAEVVVDVRDEVLAGVDEDLLVDVARGEVGLEPVVGVLVGEVVGEVLALGVLVVLVVAGPDDDGGVVAEHLDVLAGLAVDGLQEGGPGGVVAAAEHKVLPDEDAELVAGVVEGLFLVDAAAPDADHELVAVGEEADPVAVAVCGDAGDEVVGGDPVAAAAEDGDVVDLEEEGGAGLLLDGTLDELDLADAHLLGERVDFGGGGGEEGRGDGVEGLRAVADGVPQRRVLDVEGGGDVGVGLGVDGLGGDGLVVEGDVEADLGRLALCRGVGDHFGGLEGRVDGCLEIEVGEAGGVYFEIDGPPGAACQERRAPVPALVILSFANRQPRVVAVPAAPFVVGILLHQLPSAEVGAVKGDFKLILTTVLLQHGRDVDALRGEHVVRLEDGLAVQHDGGKGIQTVKGQHSLGTLRDGVRGGEGGPVQPLGLADPLDVELVLADEGVGDDAVVDEVEVDVCGELADGEQFGVLLVGLLEVPVLVDGRHAPGGCHCALGRVSCAGAVWQARAEAHCERIRNGRMPIEGIRELPLTR
ncbi:hypothetical protein CCHR01_00698 [Colletotrichum chrysophilum]|uniref:Uncharacterized protein n=1 Tax=Colletotrichum chrysophilum TaxID=1836956 RepID=A0AAD9EQE1_9PEZI|nr:hypothetical protein CCHR01_00698 [Colletotrichum chrysophilum]